VQEGHLPAGLFRPLLAGTLQVNGVSSSFRRDFVDLSAQRATDSRGSGTRRIHMARRPNDHIADRLDEIAAFLAAQSANPYRVRAYRRAAETLRFLATPVSQILATHGTPGLDQLPGIGPSLARTIRDLVVGGYSPILERLRGGSDTIRLFASVPGIGRLLAARLHDELGLETLQQLEAAAHDGRLEQIAGFGPKRLAGIRDNLALRLARVHQDGGGEDSALPTVTELLDVDREYLEKARAGDLPLIAPRRFNPEQAAWLPILHTERGSRHYTALFSNTARAHRVGKTHDWVVIYCDDGSREHQWTVITAGFGALRGQRIVRGREAECSASTTATPLSTVAPSSRPAPTAEDTATQSDVLLRSTT
jgi:DNA polymerase (family X)